LDRRAARDGHLNSFQFECCVNARFLCVNGGPDTRPDSDRRTLRWRPRPRGVRAVPAGSSALAVHAWACLGPEQVNGCELWELGWIGRGGESLTPTAW